MAKTCKTCKRTYPNKEPVCPYCKAAKAKSPEPSDEEMAADLWAEPPAEDDDLVEVLDDEPALVEAEDVVEMADNVEPLAAEEVLEAEAEPEEVLEVQPEPEEVLEVEPEEVLEVEPEEVLEVEPEPEEVLEAAPEPDQVVEEVIEVLPEEATVAADDVIEFVEDAPPAAAPAVLAFADEDKAEPPPEPRKPLSPKKPAAKAAAPKPSPLLGKEAGQPTQIAGQGVPAPTMLAAKGPPAPTMLAPKAAGAPTMLAPKIKGAPTMLAPKVAGAPTMLAPKVAGAPTMLAPKTKGAPTMLAPKAAGGPTMLAPADHGQESDSLDPGAPAAVPNLSLDSGNLDAGAAQAELLAPELVEAEDVLDVGETPAAVESASEPQLVEEVLDLEESPDAGDDVLDLTEPAVEPGDDELLTLEAAPAQAAAEEQTEALSEDVLAEDEAGDDLFGDDVLVEGASEVDLARGNKGEISSGVDIIAEALESGVGLSGEHEAATLQEAAEPAGTDLEHTVAEGPDSSAVDLGASTPDMDLNLEQAGADDADADAILGDETVAEEADEVLEEVSDEVLEEVSDEAVEEAADEVLEEVSDEVLEEVSDEAVEEAADDMVIEDAAEEALEEVSEEAMEDAALEDLLADEPASGSKGKKSTAADLEDEAADLLSSEEVLEPSEFDMDQDAAAEIADDELVDEDALVSEVDEEIIEEEEEEALAFSGKAGGKKGQTNLQASKGKGKKAPALDEDEEDEDEDRPRWRDRPKYGRRWVGGMLVSILLIAGAVAGLWYFAPEVLDEHLPEFIAMSPNHKAKDTQGVTLTPLQQARTHMAKQEFAEAVKALADAKTPEEWTARGEARWLKRVKEDMDKNVPIQGRDPEVTEALRDFSRADNKVMERQVDKALQSFTKQASQDTRDKELKDILIKNKVFAADDPALDNPSVAVGKLAASKAEQDAALVAMVEALREAKVLKEGAKLNAEALARLGNELAQAREVLGTLEGLLAAKQNALPNKVEKLMDTGKDLDDKLTKVNAALKDARVKDVNVRGVQELIDNRDKLMARKTELDVLVAQAIKELWEGEVAPPPGDPLKQLPAAVAAIRERARSPLVNALGQLASSFGNVGPGASGAVQAAVDRTLLEAQLRYYQTREPLIQTPEQKLGTWIKVFQDHQRKDGPDAVAALNDAKWVMSKESKSGPEARGRAACLEGLLHRNKGEFAEARPYLEEAVKRAEELKLDPSTGWPAVALEARAELTDAKAYYLPRAEKFRAQEQFKEALDELEVGLQAIRNDSRMLVLRGQLRLDLAGDRADASIQEKVRADVESAKKDPAVAAMAWYVAGQLEEKLGHWSEAEKDYRQALDVHKAQKGDPDEASRYRIALARLLQRERTAPAADAAPAPEPKGAGAGAGADAEESEAPPQEVRADPQLTALLVLALTGAQLPAAPVEDPVEEARLRESIALAEELIKSPDRKVQGQGHMLRGLAYSRKGQRTNGLFEYVQGLRLVHPDRSTADLEKLIRDHPAFQEPDSMGLPREALAETHYGKGLHLYWGREYALAEEQFKQAVAYYHQDARYIYFLGLSRLAQGGKKNKELADYDFTRGARLEVQNLPNPHVVNSSLERIQGRVREYVDAFRQKALAPRAEAAAAP